MERSEPIWLIRSPIKLYYMIKVKFLILFLNLACAEIGATITKSEESETKFPELNAKLNLNINTFSSYQSSLHPKKLLN